MNLCRKGISTKEVIIIKNKSKSLNEFLNIKNIDENFLYTLDNKVITFIKVYPINTELFSEEELENKMDSMSVEFSNEQYAYSIFVIPRKVDISEYVKEQEELKKNIQDEISIKIVEKRIIATHELVADKNIIENEFYLYIWEEDSDNVKEKILKRANNWRKRFKDCGFETEILEKTQIISFSKKFHNTRVCKEGECRL